MRFVKAYELCSDLPVVLPIILLKNDRFSEAMSVILKAIKTVNLGLLRFKLEMK